MVQLRLPEYEGPLDLLLELIESRKLDISELSLAQVADQYLAQVASMSPPEGAISQERADALAAFISIGGRLVLLKARQLLPSPETPPQDEEAANDARELVEMARAYKMYRDGILQLGERDREQLRSYTPISSPPIERPLPVGMSHDLTLDALARIAQEVLDRAAEREAQEEIAHDAAIERQRITVRERAGDLRARLMSGHALSFRAWIEAAESRLELIVSFMAVLELHKSLAIEIEQQGEFEDILITALPDAPDSAWAAADGSSLDE
ncbi:MAG: ScpA family protein [Chloroflexota bacterium]|nr:ScpA family protein [Chloroflexota bacterium]